MSQENGRRNGKRPAIQDGPVEKPRSWDKAVSAAYLWLIMAEVKKAAAAAGVGERTLHRWILSDWWPDAVAEAETRWLHITVAEARRALLGQIRAGDGDLALRLLERRDARLRPAPIRVGVFGAIESLPPHEVARIMALPEEQRRAEVRGLLGSGEE